MLIWAEKCLQDEAFPRADYRELLELTIVYLGGEVDRFHFQKADNKASQNQQSDSAD